MVALPLAGGEDSGCVPGRFSGVVFSLLGSSHQIRLAPLKAFAGLNLKQMATQCTL
jgi:hypothetical protein